MKTRPTRNPAPGFSECSSSHFNTKKKKTFPSGFLRAEEFAKERRELNATVSQPNTSNSTSPLPTGAKLGEGNRGNEVKREKIAGIAFVLASLPLVVGAALAQQDKWSVKAPNGVAFSEFKGYEDWQDVAVSQTETGIKAILANPVMIKAYREGIPGNGKPFPERSAVVKIEWEKVANPESPYDVNIPGALKSVSFIFKDSKRFPESSGWGYAQFLSDAKAGTFHAYGENADFGKKVCYQCHTIVKAKDYIFTAYPFR